MITFGVTGSRAQCRTALKQLKPLLSEFGILNMGSPLGKIWAHSRFRSPYVRHTLWDVGYVVDTLETAVDWNRLPDAVEHMEQSIRDAIPGHAVHVFTHLSHIYPQGASIYTSYIFPNAATYEETFSQWKIYKAVASKAVVDSGGTISHQHGVGRDHAPYLGAEKGELGLKTLGTLAGHFDPDVNLNPGVLLEDGGEGLG